MSKKSTYYAIGHFRYMNEAVEAVKQLRREGVDDLEYYSPFPCHDLDDAMYEGKARSPVRFFTLFGGLLGCTGAFLMTSWMSVDYPIRVSAKPLISFPSFIVIAFECTILLGAISTLIGMFHNSKLPNIFRMPGFRPKFTEGTFGITVKAEKADMPTLKEKLYSLGAEDVEEQYAR